MELAFLNILPPFLIGEILYCSESFEGFFGYAEESDEIIV